MLDTQAAALGSSLSDAARPDLYAGARTARAEIDALNQQIYNAVNNGACKAGSSSDQAVYAATYDAYFAALEQLETRPGDGRPYLTGERFTEADLRLFPALYRHDPVYHLRMKLNGARILDHTHLWRWLCGVHALPGVAQSGTLVLCRQGCFGRSWNATVPLGPFRPMPTHRPSLPRACRLSARRKAWSTKRA